MPRLIRFVVVGSAIVVAGWTEARAQVGAPGFPPDSPRSALPATPPAPISPRTAIPPGTPPVPAPGQFGPPSRQPLPSQTPLAPPGPTPAWQLPDSAAQPNGPPSGRIPPRSTISAFEMPPGLSRSPEQLFAEFNIVPNHSVPFTPQTTYDLAYDCYIRDLFSDAIVFADHGLRMCNDARLHLIKGVCLLHLEHGTDAEQAATDFRTAMARHQFFGLDVARERVNDPMRVRFDNIVEYQTTGR